jgi:sugar phosphate isomerase/epimerase
MVESMQLSRREFLAAGAATLVASRLAWSANETRLPLAFSTLGCPKWELAKILEFAQANGFAAVELRGMMGSLDLPSRPEFAPDRMAQTKMEIADHGIKIACVSSSTELHIADTEKRGQGIADGKRFIDLAQALGAPYVRVFGNKFEGGTREEVIARVAAGMHEMAAYSGPRGVTVIIESHGDFVDSPTLKEVLTRANSEYAGLLWDAHHTYVDGHEEPEHTVAELGKWIRHTHLKDSVQDGQERKYVLTGKGQVPVERQVQALRKIGYKGYYCFEWEKVWHPELLEPEVAFPDYVRAMTGYLTEPLKG